MRAREAHWLCSGSVLIRFPALPARCRKAGPLRRNLLSCPPGCRVGKGRHHGRFLARGKGKGQIGGGAGVGAGPAVFADRPEGGSSGPCADGWQGTVVERAKEKPPVAGTTGGRACRALLAPRGGSPAPKQGLANLPVNERGGNAQPGLVARAR